MPRKMWVKNKTAWLKSQDGPLDPETQAHIQELGLDEVRIEDVEPVEEGWEETGREEKAPHDAFIRELMGKVSRNEINMFQAAQQLSRRMGVSIQDAQDELMSSEFGTSKRKAVEQLETMIKQEVPKLADADDEVIERCGDMMKSDGVDDNTVERAKRLVRKKLKSLSDDDETGPMGLRALRRWMKAIEEDMEEIEEKNVLGAGDKAIKLMKQAMRRAYKDIAGDEEDDEVIEDTVDKSSEPWGLQWRVPGKGGWKQRDFNTEQEREKFADKITEKEGDDVEFRWSDPAQKSVAKKLSKAKRAELKDMADFLDDAATASDTPKRLSAGMKLYAQKCKDLMGPDNEPEIKSDDDLTEEQLAELDKAFQKLADSEASLTQKMFRATGMRI